MSTLPVRPDIERGWVHLDQLSDAGRRLRALATAIGANVTAEPATCRVLMEAHTLAAYHPAIAAAVQTSGECSRASLEDLIRAGITAGEWPPGTDPALVTHLFLATVHGLMAQWHLAPGSFRWDEAASVLTATA